MLWTYIFAVFKHLTFKLGRVVNDRQNLKKNVTKVYSPAVASIGYAAPSSKNFRELSRSFVERN